MPLPYNARDGSFASESGGLGATLAFGAAVIEKCTPREFERELDRIEIPEKTRARDFFERSLSRIIS